MKKTKRFFKASLPAFALLAMVAGAEAEPVEINFYYPVAIGGPVSKIFEGLIERFEEGHPDIKVNPIYSGTYSETFSKALTAYRAGQPPEVAVILSTDMFSLIDEDAIVPMEDFVKTDEDKAWLAGFNPVFMANSRSQDKTWGVPFQRGTTLFFWNKEAFKEVGLDPDKGPQNWEEVVDFATKLTKRDAGGNVERWGMQVPSSLTSYWLLQGYVAQNDGKIYEETGDKTYFDSPEVVEALQYWVDLAAKHKVMKPGVIEWATNPKDFFEGRAAMITTTSGNLTNIKTNAPFDFGVQILPEHKKRGAPTSGGNAYIFNDVEPQKQEAAFQFVKWLSMPEQSAEWSIKTGYIAARDDAWETDAMKAYVAEFPGAAVTREQIPYMVPELSTHENQRVARVIDDAIEAALTGGKPVDKALSDAQQEAERILKPYRD
ncbi:extracellular solute-binding protein [Nitratireductor indicus C115]|uniref:Extracellular solute-binding protein n=1 Tax=Nitratireductor indicus C115 TaxID=1231190 RepID=K2NPI0_9HYPH|nr:ABC transporter substrate-binding protein [Nitratireductor indicus]EKF41275.1 extracellular solute-binding protein [Nitratireductor indicus C115]SFQ65376.1 sn-glycerol 3-phosphate transport system substrate-binding protein [Nitratireductor indicus]